METVISLKIPSGMTFKVTIPKSTYYCEKPHYFFITYKYQS